MILYNITVIVDKDIEIEFKEWAHRVFLPELAKTDLFKSQALLKIIDSPNEGETFCLQMHASDEEKIGTFQQNQLILLHNQSAEVWANKIYTFESRMQYIAVY